MAGNFWRSSHYAQWILDKQDVYAKRKVDLAVLSEDEYNKIMIFFANFIQVLGETLKLRQQVIATATVYFKRFYSRNSLKNIDPFLMAPTCICLACKVEEQGPIQGTKLVQVTGGVVKTKMHYAYKQDYPYKANSVVECEFFLLEMMDCCMIVFQPYRPLREFCDKLNVDHVLPLAWRIANDSLRTDASLFYPPYLIALACIHLATVMLQKNCRDWFAELSVDFDKIQEITKLILNLYELWKEGYDEKKEIFNILEKMPKPSIKY